MKTYYRFLNLMLLLIWQIADASAAVRIPKLISDGMVLQRDAPLKIWGWADPSEKVIVKFMGKTYKTAAGNEGKWFVALPAQKAGGPYVMNISGSNQLIISDIMIGDVWFCSGQSNMVHQMELHSVTYAKDIVEAGNSNIRHFWIPTATRFDGPADDFKAGTWKVCNPENVRQFSAIAYFFALKIYEKNHVPIGLINASVGGTPVEAWTSEQGLTDFEAFQQVIARNKDTSFVNSFARRSTGNRAVEIRDKGLTGQKKWFEEGYVPQGWKTINVPGYWEDQGIKDLNGTVWYRRAIDLPAGMSSKAATVFLGRIIDADELYINGTKVGTTTYQYPQRRYKVPAGLLKAGKNLFVVKVTNTAGKGGFVPDKPYSIFADLDTIDLKGTWQYKVGEVFMPRTYVGGQAGGVPPPGQNSPSALFNAMVAPAIHYVIKGWLWYQGESNSSRGAEYARLQPAQIRDWRSKWQLGDLPFLFVQLPNFMDASYLPSESQWAELREAQLKSLDVPGTAMVVGIDAGEWNDIHPDNKKIIGERLALAAAKLAYHENIVYSGPLFRSASVLGNKMILSFDHIGSGLISKDGEELREFAVAGADKKFVWATARITGDKIEVYSEDIPSPVYVRYAWADNPDVNFYNKEGLPASPFRTDK